MQYKNPHIPIITIDGPSGVGKGTVSLMLAQHLHWHFLDSGALYRILAFAMRQQAIEPHEVTKILDLIVNLQLDFVTESFEIKIMLADTDVTDAIRTEQCGKDASKIAAILEVRTALLDLQRAFLKLPGLIADGRDMGTVVFPQADLKIYLHASPHERAMRRYLQLKNKGICVSLAQVVDELVERDARDTARIHAPLVPAADAIQIDTTELTVSQVFDLVLQYVRQKLGVVVGGN